MGDQHFLARIEHKPQTGAHGNMGGYGGLINPRPWDNIHPGGGLTNMQSGVGLDSDQMDNTVIVLRGGDYGERPRYVDHIYESPKFVRKDNSRDVVAEENGKYFELEPELESLAHSSTQLPGHSTPLHVHRPTLPSRVPPPPLDINTHKNSHLSY